MKLEKEKESITKKRENNVITKAINNYSTVFLKRYLENISGKNIIQKLQKDYISRIFHKLKIHTCVSIIITCS